MAKAAGSSLTKLKSAMKKLPSFTRQQLSRTASSSKIQNSKEDQEQELHAVYVGKSRRRYYLSSDVICHPLFQELVGKSGGFDGEGRGVVVACEVVLFEHLLWMLESSSDGTQLGSMHELAEFYTC